MSALGAIGVASQRRLQLNIAFGSTAQALIVGSGAAAGAVIIVLLRGARVAVALADDAGDWRVPGLNDGTYWAVEADAPRAWLVEVAGATVTVTPQSSGGGGGDTVIAGHAWAAIG